MARNTRRPYNAGIGYNARNDWSAGRATPNAQQQLMGMYVAQVMDDYDDQRMGRVWVYLPGQSVPRYNEGSLPTYGGTAPDLQGDEITYDQRVRNGWLLVSPMSPHFGSDDYRNAPAPDGRNSQAGDVNSYGMQAQHRIGDYVGVMFSGGDANQGFIVGAVPRHYANGMVPGVPGREAQGIDRDTTGLAGLVRPTAQLPTYDRVPTREDPTLDDAVQTTDFSRATARGGVSGDPLRGAGTSGARRESPSYVTGMKSAGWSFSSEKRHFNQAGPITPTADDGATGTADGARFEDDDGRYYDVESVGHQLSMDDHPDYQGMRIRSSGGAQILLNDAGDNPFIYMSTQEQNVWIELADSGDVSIFASGSVNLHAETDLNLTVDGNLAMDVTGDFSQSIGGSFNQSIGGDSQSMNQGSVTNTINGAFTQSIGDASVTEVGGNLDNIVGGQARTLAEGGISLDAAAGSINARAIGDFSVSTEGEGVFSFGDALSLIAGAGMDIASEGGTFISSFGGFHLTGGEGMFVTAGEGIDVTAGAGMSLGSGGATSIQAGGSVDIDGSTINLNSGTSVTPETATAAEPLLPFEPERPERPVTAQLPEANVVPGPPTTEEILGDGVPPPVTGGAAGGAGVVPQHQPWPLRAGTGSTRGTTGQVASAPVQGGFVPPSYNNSCNRGDLQANLRNGSGFPLAQIANTVIGGLSSIVGNVPQGFAAAPFSGFAPAEAPNFRAVQLPRPEEVARPGEWQPSGAVQNFIRSRNALIPFPQLDSLLQNRQVGFGRQVQVGDILGGQEITSDAFAQINSLGNTNERGFGITREEADNYFVESLEEVLQFMIALFGLIEMTRNQFEGLFSFIHHITPQGLLNDALGPSLIGNVQAGNMDAVQNQMLQFSHVGGAVDCGVLDRRRIETGQFGTLPDRGGITGQAIEYVPDGQTVQAGDFTIDAEVFNAICFADETVAPELPDGYLFTLAAIESSFNPFAQNTDSSAGGLFQFTTGTGAEFDISTDRAPNSTAAQTSGFQVYEPTPNANAGARYAARIYQGLIHRGLPTRPTDLYIGHFMGETGGIQFLNALAQNPNAIAANDRPSYAASNPNVYFEGGRARTRQEVYNFFDRKFNQWLGLFVNFCEAPATPPEGLEDSNNFQPGPPGTGRTRGPDANGRYFSNIGLIPWVRGARNPYFENTSNDTISRVEQAGVAAGLPYLSFNNGYRWPSTADGVRLPNFPDGPVSNRAVGGKRRSQHIFGRAFDLHAGWLETIARKRLLIDALCAAGMSGLGIGTNTFHADTRPGGKATWTYDGGNAWCIDILRTYGFRV